MGSPLPLPWGWLEPGTDRTHQNRALQYLLRARGHTVTVDGVYGPQTQAAVAAFQGAQHLSADGICGPETYPHLVFTIQRGSTGDEVRAAQEMIDSGGYSLSVDGDFGPQTEHSIRQLQEAWAPPVDGIVGPITWARLTAYDAP